ncbi:hypothetical protein ACSSS7_003718 [Eimeria intestinalis]
MSMPDATPCPGGFMEQLIDGDKLCVATRVARMRLACWGPFERLEGDICIEEKCENIVIEAPKPVCPPGYFVFDSFCVRRRVIPCVEPKESPPLLPSKGKEYVGREWPKDTLSKHLLDRPGKAALPMPLDLHQGVDEVHKFPSAGRKFESGSEAHSFEVLEQSETPLFVDAKFPPAGLVEGVSFENTFEDATRSPVYQTPLVKDLATVSTGASFSSAQQVEPEGEAVVKRWNAGSSSSFLGVDDDVSGTTHSLALTRRLQSTKQTPAQGELERREDGVAVGPEASGSQRTGEAQSSASVTDDDKGRERLEDLSRQALMGVPFLPGQSGMYLGGSLLTVSRRPLMTALNPALMPLQSAYGSLWHDNRFGYSVGARLFPRALKSQDASEQSSAQSPPTSVVSSPSENKENGTNTSSATSKPNTKQLFPNPANRDDGSKDSSSSSEKKGQHPEALSPLSQRSLTKGEDAALKESTESDRLSGRQQDIGVAELPSAQRQKGVHADALKGKGSHRSRRLDGGEFIPGCWEEDIQVPTDWVCQANFEFDRDQHICLRMEIFSPDILCDGHVENNLCVRENRKPSQLYCPLDPPPKLEEKKKKKKKEDKKKDEKKDPQKDPKKDEKKDDKKPDAIKKPESPSKPTNDEQKKPEPGQGESKGSKRTKGGVESPPGGRSAGAGKTPKPGGSETGGASKIKRTGGVHTKSQSLATSVQEAAEGRREGTAGSAAPGNPHSGSLQSRTSRPPTDRRSERQEAPAETQRPESAAEDEEAQSARRSEPSRQRPASRRRPGERSDGVRPQAQYTESEEEGENRVGSRATQSQQPRPSQAVRRVSTPPRAQGRRWESQGSRGFVREDEDDEEAEDEDTDNDSEWRSGDLTARPQVPQRSSVQPRGRPRPPLFQPARSRQDRTSETQTDDDDDDERSGDLTAHLFGRRLQPEPEHGKEVQSRHQRHNDIDSGFLPQEGTQRAAGDGVAASGNQKQHDDEDSHSKHSGAVPPEQKYAPLVFVERGSESEKATTTETHPLLGVTTSDLRRRLNQTRLPFAYFIMGVNQWRYIHDPVHLLREETASDRAQEQAALRHNPPLEQVGYLDPRMGVFGLPTHAGPQKYTHDLKDKKKPTASPLKIREGTLCYRQERRRPLVICPPGFTANKEGGCYMEIAPEFTCLAGYFYEHGLCVQHRELEVGAPKKKMGSKGKSH